MDKINIQKLSKLVAADSGYFKYEVDDILDSFIRVIFKQLKEGKEININNLGTFYVKTKAANKVFLHKIQDYHNFPERKRVMFKVAHSLKKSIEPTYDLKGE